MRALGDYSDSRLRMACVYCGGPPESRDHVPSRVLLDDPFPDNLPVVPACLTCNDRFSKDEEYLACLLEVVRVGSTSITPSMRPKIQRIFVERPSLAARVETGQDVVQPGRYRYLTAIDHGPTVRVVLSEYLACEVQ